MFLAVLVWLVNQLARLGEAAVMRFPLQTCDCSDAACSVDR